LQQVTSLGRRAQSDTSAVSYWLRPRGAVRAKPAMCHCLVTLVVAQYVCGVSVCVCVHSLWWLFHRCKQLRHVDLDDCCLLKGQVCFSIDAAASQAVGQSASGSLYLSLRSKS